MIPMPSQPKITDARARAAFSRFFRGLSGFARRTMRQRGQAVATLRSLDLVAAAALALAAIVNAELAGSGGRPFRLRWAVQLRSQVKRRLATRKARGRKRGGR